MFSVRIGSAVVFSDQHGRRLNAICLTTFGGEDKPDELVSWEGECGPTINLVFADPEPDRRDSYGRQVKRETSVPHYRGSTAPGFWWALPEEL